MILKSLYELDKEFKKYSQLLLNSLQKPELLRNYLEKVYSNPEEFFSISIIDVLAKINNIDIAVARLGADKKLNIIFKSQEKRKQTVKLLFTMAGTEGGFYNDKDKAGANLNHFNFDSPKRYAC